MVDVVFINPGDRKQVYKDSMDGHWEMMGLPVEHALSLFPNGFPADLIDKLKDFSKRDVIVNKPYSGTVIVHDYGEKNR